MTPAPRTLPRRTVLAVSGTAVLAAAAACSSASTTAESAVSAASSAASSVKDEVTAAASSARSAASSAVSSVKEQVSSAVAADPTTAQPTPSATAPSGTPLASVASVESAKSVVVGEDQNAVLLASSNGTVVAHTAVCTHQGCVIAASGACPCHGSKYDVQTGAVIAAANGNPPGSQQPLAEVSVTVFDGQVYKV